MTYKIVSDSSSNLFSMDGVDYAYVSLKINSPEKEYIDTPDLDLNGMIEDLKHVKGPTRTSCPNVHEWSEAFADADYAFAPEDGVIAAQFETVCKCADGAVADVIYEEIPKILTIKA